MANFTDLLALIADLHRALDRQAETTERMVGRLIDATTAGFERVDTRFGQIDKRLDKMDQRFEQMDQRFERMDQRFERMDQRAARNEERLDATLHHLSAMTENLVALNGQMGRLNEKADLLNDSVSSLVLETRLTTRKLSSIDDSVARMEKFQQTQEDVLRRLGVLESAVLRPATGGESGGNAGSLTRAA